MLKFLLSSILLLAFVSTAYSYDCNHSPTSSNFNNAWWIQFKAWCRGCGGTICETYSDCQGTCTPGPNWGGGNSGGSSGSSGSYSMPTSSDPSMALMQGMMQGMMQGLQNSNNQPAPQPVYKSPEQIEAERQAAIAAARELERKRAEKAARLDNQALGMVALLRDSTPDVGAKGKPIIDCKETKSKRDRLAAGLPQQKEAIKKTRDQLEEAKKATTEASEETKKALNEAVLDEAKKMVKETLKTTEQLKGILEKARAAQHLSPEKAAEIKEAIVELEEGVGAVKKLAKSGKAGYEFGKSVQQPMQTMGDRIAKANKLFVDSGIAEKVGEHLAETVGGPLGALSFRAVKLSIDVSYSVGKGMISYAEVQRAEQNLGIMEQSLRDYESKIVSWDQDLCSSCKSEGYCQ